MVHRMWVTLVHSPNSSYLMANRMYVNCTPTSSLDAQRDNRLWVIMDTYLFTLHMSHGKQAVSGPHLICHGGITSFMSNRKWVTLITLQMSRGLNICQEVRMHLVICDNLIPSYCMEIRRWIHCALFPSCWHTHICSNREWAVKLYSVSKT